MALGVDGPHLRCSPPNAVALDDDLAEHVVEADVARIEALWLLRARFGTVNANVVPR